MITWTKPNTQTPLAALTHRSTPGTPTPSRGASAVNVPEVVKELDRLQNSGHLEQAQKLIEHWVSAARQSGDWRSDFRCKVSLWGCTAARATRPLPRAPLRAVLSLYAATVWVQPYPGATIMLNTATTMKFLGLSAEALPIFRHVSRVYSETLDPGDYRFAGLYNNMALAFEDTGDYDSAQRHFFMALDIIKRCKDPGNDTAVTWCNLAELYERMGRDEDIEACARQCLRLSHRSGASARRIQRFYAVKVHSDL